MSEGWEEEDICRNNHGGNPESEEANGVTRKGVDRAKIWALLDEYPGGLICEEVEVLLGMKHQTASARWSEMHRDCLIEYKMVGGQKERRLTRSGCWAAVSRKVKWEIEME